jgi:hypothetical protein
MKMSEMNFSNLRSEGINEMSMQVTLLSSKRTKLPTLATVRINLKNGILITYV